MIGHVSDGIQKCERLKLGKARGLRHMVHCHLRYRHTFFASLVTFVCDVGGDNDDDDFYRYPLRDKMAKDSSLAYLSESRNLYMHSNLTFCL